MTSRPCVRAGSSKSATGWSTQSELEPSAWRVELPSKFHTGKLLERRLGGELDDLRLAAQVRHRLVTVEPDVFELELRHRCSFSCWTNKKGPTTPEEW